MAKSNQNRSFVVLGLGTFGSTVANVLAEFGNHVLGIDSDEQRVSGVADNLADALIADVRDEEALREAGVGNFDVGLVAIGEDLEANILCTMNLKLLGVKCIWVKAVNRTHHRILSRLGADRVILPEQEMGQHIAQMLHNPMVRDYISLGSGLYIVDLIVPEQLLGKTIADLGLAERFEIRCLGLLRGGQYHDDNHDTLALQDGDMLLLLGRREKLRTFGDSL